MFNGLMILPPFFDQAEATRPYFKRLRAIRDEILPGGQLSMGMSHDFEIAIEEGRRSSASARRYLEKGKEILTADGRRKTQIEITFYIKYLRESAFICG